MTNPDETTNDVASVWSASGQSPDLDEDCNPNKVCRNMKEITFDGYAEPGTDLTAAWKATLEREGKLSPDGESLRDLVFGSGR
ncbi:MAG: hypothetical protein KDB69_10485 [Acidimicrobiia bacterium]|nr:hypothetical protein [Acidimicrobiia bacterium]